MIPNIALIEELKKKHPNLKFVYIGSTKPIEKELLKNEPVTFEAIQTGKLRRYLSMQNVIDFFKVPIGVIQSFIIMKKYQPKLLFSKGGYVALPVVLGAHLAKVPVIIHESDATPGLATTITSKYATEVWTSYEDVIEGAEHIQLPIRKALLKGNKANVKFKEKKPTLLVMGGSLGAVSLNTFIEQNLSTLLKEFNVIHITGKGKKKLKSKKCYKSYEFVTKELPDFYAKADVVLSRAGASALTELAALGKKTILVPLPTTKSRGEQLVNAQAFVDTYGGAIIEDEKLSLRSFKETLSSIHSSKKSKSAPKAVKKIEEYLR